MHRASTPGDRSPSGARSFRRAVALLAAPLILAAAAGVWAAHDLDDTGQGSTEASTASAQQDATAPALDPS